MLHWLNVEFWQPVWPNLAAAPLCALGALILGWLLRHRIGRGLARWWHKHWTAHLAEVAAREKGHKP